MPDEDHSSSEPLAIFGGTFDPVHYGHLRCADEARQKLNLKTLLLLPAGTPPAPQATTGNGKAKAGHVAVGPAGVSTLEN